MKSDMIDLTNVALEAMSNKSLGKYAAIRIARGVFPLLLRRAYSDSRKGGDMLRYKFFRPMSEKEAYLTVKVLNSLYYNLNVPALASVHEWRSRGTVRAVVCVHLTTPNK